MVKVSYTNMHIRKTREFILKQESNNL